MNEIRGVAIGTGCSLGNIWATWSAISASTWVAVSSLSNSDE